MNPRGDLQDAAAPILGRRLSDEETEKLNNYLNLILKWQRIHRLVGSDDRNWILQSLLLDSLLFTKVLPREAKEIADLGSGAGIPGIPLAIVLPSTRMRLIEARQKRVAFLATAIRELRLDNARVHSGHLEEAAVPPELSGSFDAVVGRCAGDLGKVIPVGLLLVRSGGVVVFSGPPRSRPLPSGGWLTIPGVEPGTLRRFAVVTKP